MGSPRFFLETLERFNFLVKAYLDLYEIRIVVDEFVVYFN